MKFVSTKILALAMFLLAAFVGQSQRLSVGILGGTNASAPILDWNTGIERQNDSIPAENAIHFGATAKFQLFERLYLRGDAFYKATTSVFGADYKVVDELWTTNATIETQTIHLLVAPQIHFFPRNLAYAYVGLMLEINRGADFTYGQFLQQHKDGTTTTVAFDTDAAQNTTSPAAVLGLGLHPRFGRLGLFVDARYSRSRPSAVHTLLPRIGQENFALSGGLTFDIIR